MSDKRLSELKYHETFDLRRLAQHDQTQHGLAAQDDLIAWAKATLTREAKKRDPHYGYPVEWMNAHVTLARTLLWQAQHPHCKNAKKALIQAQNHLEQSQLTGDIWGTWYGQEQKVAKALAAEVSAELGLNTYLRDDRDGR